MFKSTQPVKTVEKTITEDYANFLVKAFIGCVVLLGVGVFVHNHLSFVLH